MIIDLADQILAAGISWASNSQGFACLCLLGTEIKGGYHYVWPSLVL